MIARGSNGLECTHAQQTKNIKKWKEVNKKVRKKYKKCNVFKCVAMS